MAKMNLTSFSPNFRMENSDMLKFIRLYKSEPVLWNPKNPQYKNRERRFAACRRVASALDVPEFTARHVSLKFKSIRSSYSQELKKIADSKKTAKRKEDVYTPKIFWFKNVNCFLQPHVTFRKFFLVNEYKRDPYENTDIHEETLLSNEQLQDPTVESELDIKSALLQDPILLRLTPVTRSVKKRRDEEVKRKLNDNYGDFKSAEHEMASPTPTLNVHEDRKDSFDHFGTYIASLLRSFRMGAAIKTQGDVINLVLKAVVSNTRRKISTGKSFYNHRSSSKHQTLISSRASSNENNEDD